MQSDFKRVSWNNINKEDRGKGKESSMSVEKGV